MNDKFALCHRTKRGLRSMDQYHGSFCWLLKLLGGFFPFSCVICLFLKTFNQNLTDEQICLVLDIFKLCFFSYNKCHAGGFMPHADPALPRWLNSFLCCFFNVLQYFSPALSLCHSHTVLPKLLLYTFLFTLTLRIGENNSWASKFQRLG